MLTNQTGHYYFNLLSEEEQKQFKENCVNYKNEQHFERYLNVNHDDFYCFLSGNEILNICPFVWAATIQSDSYWRNIANSKYKQPTPEPKEPTNSELLTMIVGLKKEINMLKSHLNIQE